jgi:hypothetical protein
MFNTTALPVGQEPLAPPCEKFTTETPEQNARHREIARRYASKSRERGRHRPNIVAFRIRDLQKLFADRYGTAMPDDDAARDDLMVLLHHVAHLGDSRALRAYAARWCPWLSYGEFAAIIAEIEYRPLRWRADSLARRIGLDDATRTRLRITTIGATDCAKAQRTKRAKRKDAAYQKEQRAKAGAKPQASSAARLRPWLALGMSRRTYYRKLAIGTLGTNSSGAALMYAARKQCHADRAGGPSRVSRDRPRRSDELGNMLCTADDDREIPAVNTSDAEPLNLIARAAFARASPSVSRVRTGDLGAQLTHRDRHTMQKMVLEHA